MGRGPALKTKVKAEKALTKAKLQAKKEWEERKANVIYHLKKEFIGVMRKEGPVKLLVFGGTAYLVYNTLIASKIFIDRVADVFPHLFITGIGGFGQLWIQPLILMLGWNVTEETQKEIKNINLPILLASLTIAYIIVEHPEVITEMFGAANGIVQLGLLLLK